ncbi:MAG: glycosyltransferase family 39 protein [Nanoarchaeota archaeon]|nr:glycosyltransferase family 39 protein [Nanoarchaeota archaeon]
MDFKRYLNFLPVILILNFFLIVYSIVKISEETLFWFYSLVLIINLLLIVISICLGYKDIISGFKKIKKSTWIILIIILLFGFYLRMFVAPQSHHIFFDEDIYLNIAQNIVNEGKACLCNYGNTENCFSCISNKQPYGLSAFYAIFFFLFGVSETVAVNVSIIIATFSILLVFLVSYLLFRKEKISVYSALVFTLIPIHIRWSVTQALGPLLVFFSLLTILLFLIYLEKRKGFILFAFFCTLAYTCQIRPESMLMAAVAASFFVFMDNDIFKTVRDRKFLIALALFLILILPTVEHTDNMKYDNWGASGNMFSKDIIKRNLADNSKFFVENTRFPLIFAIFSIIGIIFGLYKYPRKIVSFIIWFLLFFAIFIPFYAGSFNYGKDVRFSLNLYPSVVIFCGLGFYSLNLILLKRFKQKKQFAELSIYILVILLILFSFIPFIGLVSNYGENGWDAKAAHDFAVSEAPNIKNCIVISKVPSMFLVEGVPSIQLFLVSDKMMKLHKEYDCVMFYEGYWCINFPEDDEGVCSNFKNNYNLKIYKSSQTRDKTYTFYRVEK